jgi:hypothetical protein
MRKFIYQSIVEKLKDIKDGDDRSVIRHFDIWNNNLVYIKEEQAFYTPAVFIEFQTIEWRQKGGGVRDAAVTVALHVLTQHNAPTSNESDYEAQALEFFDLLTGINCCLHGHFKTGYDFAHDDLTAKTSITDHDFEELRHDIETFACHAQDCSALPEPVKVNIAKVEFNMI